MWSIEEHRSFSESAKEQGRQERTEEMATELTVGGP